MQQRAEDYPLEAHVPLDVIAGAEQAFSRLQEIFFGENKHGLSVTLEGIHKPLCDYLRMMESMPDTSKPMEKIAAEAKKVVECGNHPDYLKRLATLANADWIDHRNTLEFGTSN